MENDVLQFNHTSNIGYRVVFGELCDLHKHIGEFSKVLLLCDKNVERLWGDRVLTAIGAGDVRVYTVETGEESKSCETVAEILTYMTDNAFDRDSLIVALGGGVVGDIGGFAAMVYMRGIGFVNVPTTLLSMCDSCIGGKNGVNFKGYKNYIGGFYYPKFVYISTEFLKTLDRRQYVCGLAEMVKTALLFDRGMYEKIASKSFPVDGLIVESLKWKNKAVSADIFDKGARRVLNYGHTVGHAVEFASRYKLNHGEAVALGISIENRLAVKMGILDDGVRHGIAMTLTNLGFDLSYRRLDLNELTDALTFDKKNSNKRISFILIRDIGEPVFVDYDVDTVKEFLRGI